MALLAWLLYLAFSLFDSPYHARRIAGIYGAYNSACLQMHDAEDFGHVHFVGGGFLDSHRLCGPHALAVFLGLFFTGLPYVAFADIVSRSSVGLALSSPLIAFVSGRVQFLVAFLLVSLFSFLVDRLRLSTTLVWYGSMKWPILRFWSEPRLVSLALGLIIAYHACFVFAGS